MRISPTSSENARGVRLLWACVGLVVLALALPLWMRTRGRPFNPIALETITKEKPAIVFIGNSMVWSRMDLEVFRKAGKPAYYYRQDPTYVPSWYLMLKNYVAASPHRPERVFLLFRDDELTNIHWNFSPYILNQLEAYRHFHEPDFDRLAFARSTRNPVSESLAKVSRFYRDAREMASETITARLAVWTPRWTLARTRTNEFLNGSGRRPASAGVNRADTVRHTDGSFASTVESSWLPLFLKIAKQENIPLCFFRVKRSPVERSRQGEYLQKYMRDLRDYFLANDVCFYDENDESFVTDDFYLGPADDHIATTHQARYSQWFLTRYAGAAP